MFIAGWRRIELSLRRQVSRWGAPEQDIDDLLSEAFIRLFRAEATAADDRALLALADVVARRVLLDWMRRDKRRTASLRRRGLRLELSSSPEVEGEELADLEALDAEQAAVLRLAVEDKLAKLTRQQRRAVALIRRGGPYTNAEKVAIHRGRKELDDVFRDLLGGIGATVGRWRERVGALFASMNDPNPLLPVLAGAASAIGLAGLAVSAAAPVPTTRPMAVPRAGGLASEANAAAIRSAESAVAPHRQAALATGAVTDDPDGVRAPAAGGPVRLATQRPDPVRGGTAGIAIARDVPDSHGTTKVGVHIYCDTAVRQAACAVWRAAGPIPAW